MKIELIGINHNSPLSRRKYIDVLNGLKEKYKKLPELIAVEWKESNHIKIAKQRKQFQELLPELFKKMDPIFYSELSLSLGYEGDAHTTVFPDSRTIWLEENTDFDETAVIHFATYRLDTLKDFMKTYNPKCKNHEKIFQHLDKTAQERSSPPKMQYEKAYNKNRENSWNKILEKENSLPKNSWGIVTVGSLHLLGEFPDLLKNSGFDCHQINCLDYY